MQVKIKTENVETCPLCSSMTRSPVVVASIPDYIKDVSKTFYPLSKCKECSFVYITERPVQKDLQHYYPHTCPNFKSSVTTAVEKSLVGLKQMLFSSSEEKVPKKLKVLDVGFGPGDFLNSCFEKGHDCYGVDFSEFAFEEAKRKNPELKLFLGTLYEADYEEGYFDLINFSHVVEHEYDPLKMLRYVKNLLKKGGKVTIDVPNYGGLYYSIAGKKADYFVPQHTNFFTPQSMEFLLQQAGFSDFNVISRFGNNLSYHILKTLGIQKSFYNKSLLNQVLGLAIVPVEVLLNKGDAIFAEAKK